MKSPAPADCGGRTLIGLPLLPKHGTNRVGLRDQGIARRPGGPPPLFLLLVMCLPLFASDDWTIAPARVGPITSATTREQLDRLFPADAVRDDEIELDEGMQQKATLVYRGDPSRTLAISWNAGHHPKQVFVCFGRRRGPCHWELANGIKIGTRLDELGKRNGGPFTISGFGYNYGGNVLSWNGGNLASLDCGGGRVVLNLDADRTRDGDYSIGLTSEERHSISGDRPIGSWVPAMLKVNPAVVGLLVQFTGPPCH